MAMKLDHEDLNHLIDKISTSDIQEFSLEGEDFKLEIKRNQVETNHSTNNPIPNPSLDKQINSSQEVVKEETRLYRQGRSALNTLIQAKDNEKNSRLQLIQNAVQFYKLYYQFLALIDQLDNDLEITI